MSYRFATEKTVQRSRGISNLGWPFFIATLAILPAALLLVVLLLIPRQSPKQATQSQPARSVVNSWSGNALVVHCAGFSAGETITIFLTPSLSGMAGTRELIAVLAANAQGACDASPRLIDPELATRQGWLLVAQGVTPDSVASSPFLPQTVPQPQAQPRTLLEQSAPVMQETSPPQPPTPFPTPAPKFPDNLWQVSYYPDRDQISTPVVNEANNINFDSRNGWPGYYGIPTNNFRAVFSGTFLFNETRSYLFRLRLRGSARVYIDNRLAIDQYHIGRKLNDEYRLPVSAGAHSIQIDYYNDYGPAAIFFDWRPDSNRYDYWLGRYYNNVAMEGTPAMIRQDDALTFNWPESPGGDVAVDNFSVQWLRAMQVPRNGCVCRMYADDKVRVYVDNNLVPELSNWDAPNAWDKTVRLNGGRRIIEVQFVEQGGEAMIQFTCDPVTPAY